MRLAGAVAPLLLAGCVQATLPRVGPGGTPSKGMAILMGELRIIPPVAQNEPGARGALIVGDMNGNFLATFTGSMKDEYSRSAWPPIGAPRPRGSRWRGRSSWRSPRGTRSTCAGSPR